MPYGPAFAQGSALARHLETMHIHKTGHNVRLGAVAIFAVLAHVSCRRVADDLATSCIGPNVRVDRSGPWDGDDACSDRKSAVK